MSFSNFSGAPPPQPGHGGRPSASLLAALALLAAVAVCLGIAFERGKPVKVLEPQVSIERPIQGGQRHRYAFELAAGDFLRVRVDQGTPDLVVRLLDSREKEILAVDDPISQSEDEDLAAVVEKSGSYVVEVAPLDAGAAEGSYKLLAIDGPRPATKGDRWRAKATDLTQQADNLHFLSQGDTKSQKEEVGLREEALDLWRRVGDRRREARMLFGLGLVHWDLEDYEQAGPYYHEAAEIFEELEEFSQCANTLNGAGRVARKLHQDEEALRDFQQALQFASLGSDRGMEATILSNLGDLLTDLGEPEGAIEHLKAALRLGQNLESEAKTLNSLGRAYRQSTQYLKAKESLEKGLALVKGEAPDLEATLHNSLGGIERVLGNWDTAIHHFEQALQLQPEDRSLLATIHNNLAFVYQRVGERGKALEHYRQALDLGTNDTEVRVKALSNMSLLELQRGRPDKAVQLSQRALDSARGTSRFEAPALESLGRAEAALGYTQAAREHLGEALLIASRANDKNGEATATLALAETEHKARNLDTALEYARTARAMVETLRTGVTGQDLRASFLATKLDYYEIYIDILMELYEDRSIEGYEAQALHASEMARARSLLDILGDAENDPRQTTNPQEAEARRLRAAVDDREEQRLKASPERLKEAERRLQEAKDRLQQFLRTYPPSFADLAAQEPLDLEGIQSQVLGPGTLLIEYSLGAERSYLWAVTQTSIDSYELPPRSDIEDAARLFYNHVSTRHPLADQDAARLSRILLKPVEHLLHGQTLLVVGDGALQYIPFTALPLPSSLEEGKPRPLVYEHQVVNLPSASVLAALRQKLDGQPAPPKTLAVFADPVFSKKDRRFVKAQTKTRGSKLGSLFSPPSPRLAASRTTGSPEVPGRLQYSEVEADGILALVPREQRFEARGFEASRQTVYRERLDQYRIVHFATHGRLNAQHPEHSSLILSLIDEKGAPQDGYLRLLNIYGLVLNADLVVLSACETALGKEIRGEGLVGLTRGFMDAGSKRVLASLWNIEDRSTAQLMPKFYRHLLVERKSVAEALRQAQIEMAENPRTASPYYWAGFSLQGEWR